MGKRKRKQSTTPYFAEREEKAVVDYINSKVVAERHRIYNEILKEPFRKMVESILRRYPIHIGNYDIYEVEANGLSHLVEHMVKFNPNKITKTGKKTKAFSYCQTIVRNYFKDHSKKSYNETKTILSWEDYSDEILHRKEYLYEIDDNSGQSDLEKLMELVIKAMRDRIKNDPTLKKNEIIVGEAIIKVLSNWHILFMEETPEGKVSKKITNKYQKNKILLLLKEETRLNTKEIRMSMKPFKEIYYFQKSSFFNDDD